MSRKVMQQALEALEWNYNTDLDNIPACEQWAKMLKETITALRAALAEPEQNPFGDDAERYARKLHEEREYYKALFTAPTPRKPLLASEIVTMYAENPSSDAEMIEFARAIERAHGIGGGE